MSPALNHLGGELFSLFGQLSFELAVLAFIVAVVSCVLKTGSPALRHFLWIAAQTDRRAHGQFALDLVHAADGVPGTGLDRFRKRSLVIECHGFGFKRCC